MGVEWVQGRTHVNGWPVRGHPGWLAVGILLPVLLHAERATPAAPIGAMATPGPIGERDWGDALAALATAVCAPELESSDRWSNALGPWTPCFTDVAILGAEGVLDATGTRRSSSCWGATLPLPPVPA